MYSFETLLYSNVETRVHARRMQSNEAVIYDQGVTMYLMQGSQDEYAVPRKFQNLKFRELLEATKLISRINFQKVRISLHS